MTIQRGGSPVVTDMRVIPVAGHDSMLLNLSGAHAPFFTRNVTLPPTRLATRARRGPGAERILHILEDSRPFVIGQELSSANEILHQVRQRFASEDQAGRGTETFDLQSTVHAVTAIECALLDLMGQFLGVSVASLLGEGRIHYTHRPEFWCKRQSSTD